MRLLFVSSLYPNSIRRESATYNRQLVFALSEKVDVSVIAPVLWFPGVKPEPDGKLPPFREEIDGVLVTHPRVFYTPGIFLRYHWQMYRSCLRKHFYAVVNEFKPDAVLIGFLYPDASAVVPLCNELRIPYALRVNGSDFRIRTKQAGFRSIIVELLQQAPLIFCPGEALRRDIVQSGIHNGKVIAFRNGVDPRLFRFRTDSDAMKEFLRKKWCLPYFERKQYVLFVGNLQKVKGADRLILSWREICQRYPYAKLLLIGDGPERKRLERMACSISGDVQPLFLGILPHEIIGLWMNIADCICVPSRSEGMPNVIVESLASGTPVVATDVGEIPFMIKDGINGYIIRTKNVSEKDIVTELAVQLERALVQNWDRRFIAEHSGVCTWDEAATIIVEGMKKLLA